MKNKPLSDLKIRNAKIKEKDYQLGDMEGLYLLIKKIEKIRMDKIIFHHLSIDDILIFYFTPPIFFTCF